ncbi:RICIN domain-containing protein [Rhodococcus marinonascens]|uniref:RICIN domain-containing protein n=1 Tax=Rhodococcus marinonascens TaxID=38311 RepID=UPI001FE517C5|nr:RICIN domain-containing protein [Rhodococcus marinonascens]
MDQHSTVHRHPTVRGRVARLTIAVVTAAMVPGIAGIGAAVADTVTDTVPVGRFPEAVAITPDGSRAYTPNNNDDTVSVIDTGTDMVTATVPVGSFPIGVAITPDGSLGYVTNSSDSTVSVIDTGTNTVIETVPIGDGPSGDTTSEGPIGLAITPDGSRAYVSNFVSGTVSVIAIDTQLDSPIYGLDGRVLDIVDDGTVSGTPVQMWDHTGAENQQWKKIGNQIVNPHTQKCLDVVEAVNGSDPFPNGAPIQISDCGSQTSEQWRMADEVTDGNPVGGAIINIPSEKCLDVTDNVSANGTRLQLWDCTGAFNQQFNFPPSTER